MKIKKTHKMHYSITFYCRHKKKIKLDLPMKRKTNKKKTTSNTTLIVGSVDSRR